MGTEWVLTFGGRQEPSTAGRALVPKPQGLLSVLRERVAWTGRLGSLYFARCSHKNRYPCCSLPDWPTSNNVFRQGFAEPCEASRREQRRSRDKAGDHMLWHIAQCPKAADRKAPSANTALRHYSRSQ
jgi:hypothetical protein